MLYSVVMTNTTKTEAAQVATLIRAQLKKAFPGMPFAVRSKNYSGGDSVTVGWTNGPAVDAVQAIAEKFEAGSFDGMTDSYTYRTDRKGPTTKFVFCERRIDSALAARVVAELRAMFSSEPGEGFETLSYRILRKADLRNGYAGLRSVDGFPGFEVIPAATVSEAA